MNERKKRQFIVFGGGLAVVLGASFFIFGALSPDSNAKGPERNEKSGVDISVVQDKTSGASPELTWAVESRRRVENLTKQVENLTKTIQTQQSVYEEKIKGLQAVVDSGLEQQALKIDKLSSNPQSQVTGEADIGQPPAGLGPGTEFVRQNGAASPSGGYASQSPFTRTRAEPPSDGSGDVARRAGRGDGSFIETFTLTETVKGEASSVRDLSNYIPAGSYAPAIVISGADAATNVADRENPIPVLMRISGPAVTAAYGDQKQYINIKGCLAQGSAIGDLSSERVMVRLVTLSCTNGRGEILETKVSGYVAGRGKSGVRGRVVSREGNLVTKAGIAGIFGGLAGAATPSTDGSLDSVSQLLKQGAISSAAGGVREAGTILSEYYIKRAEQYQPVVSLNSGTEVELVFMEGVELE